METKEVLHQGLIDAVENAIDKYLNDTLDDGTAYALANYDLITLRRALLDIAEDACNA